MFTVTLLLNSYCCLIETSFKTVCSNVIYQRVAIVYCLQKNLGFKKCELVDGTITITTKQLVPKEVFIATLFTDSWYYCMSKSKRQILTRVKLVHGKNTKKLAMRLSKRTKRQIETNVKLALKQLFTVTSLTIGWQ